ncbi:TPA: hypothetical protein N0F65_001582 [Lagenidium giganteum]|uniref:Small integral membrane protein 15 n=1 Tax=Lagenidium giganteum TaxID=4803 RepID=A0AAV2Z306_9STRA|nr:TPA: hypothetical protein N0F65_001582 [Lagenidium giganteum]
MTDESDNKMAKLAARLAQPPETWVDVIMVAFISDPYFYGCCACLAIVLLAAVALWATITLLRQMDREDKQRQRQRDASEEDSKKRK